MDEDGEWRTFPFCEDDSAPTDYEADYADLLRRVQMTDDYVADNTLEEESAPISDVSEDGPTESPISMTDEDISDFYERQKDAARALGKIL